MFNDHPFVSLSIYRTDVAPSGRPSLSPWVYVKLSPLILSLIQVTQAHNPNSLRRPEFKNSGVSTYSMFIFDCVMCHGFIADVALLAISVTTVHSIPHQPHSANSMYTDGSHYEAGRFMADSPWTTPPPSAHPPSTPWDRWDNILNLEWGKDYVEGFVRITHMYKLMNESLYLRKK